jgi:hypothetical protein
MQCAAMFNRWSVTALLLFVCPLRCAAFISQGGQAVWGRHSLPVTDQWVQIPNHHAKVSSHRSAAASVTNDWFSGVENNVFDEVTTVRNLSEKAILFCGDTRGREALLELGTLCDRRLPFDFESTQGPGQAEGSVISHVPAILPRHVTEKVFERVKVLEREGLLSTNPDSVDGLPSFHLNLVSGGQPLVALDEDKDNLDDFKLCLQDLLGLVEPYIYDELLPKVNQLMNSSSIRVADIFLRRYGQDLIDDKSRNGISAHYDVFSRVTSVIALDDVGAEGTNGLFTTQVEDGKTSNHAALRRFFPLARGDGVVHTWDLLHGVDVEPGLDRTSLIVWFTTEEELDPNQYSPPAPWLFEQQDLETNDVGQFVLASAIVSSDESFRDDSSWGSKSPSETMSQASSTTDDHDDHNHSRSTGVSHHPFDLYLDSASRENTFALTRLGSLCEDNMLDEEMTSRANDLLCRLRPDAQLPKILRQREDDSTSMSTMDLAKRFWFEGAVRGNPLAQIALGDEIMFEASESGEADARLLAAVLFGLAAQQGNEQAMDSLKRVVEFDVAVSAYETQEDFLRSPVVQVAEAASCRLLDQ